MPYPTQSRKWLLACFFALTSSVALFTGHLEGGEWVMCSSFILGLYGSINVAQKRKTL